ncbi:hypothetical protein CC78DRAFT_618516 [Lojkania enalia]|uniref:Uncharacterized protein n=1 Tax=Lojkania enalia TaxID=147567 RepID=A0A9P4K6E2_9PLEO|nr:hypothetical protein CC78DRAFT_618516 [Didymosphaeria enalia]
MFKPSPILQKRIPKRLRRYRSPAYLILQSALRSVHPSAKHINGNASETLGVESKGWNYLFAEKPVAHVPISITARQVFVKRTPNDSGRQRDKNLLCIFQTITSKPFTHLSARHHWSPCLHTSLKENESSLPLREWNHSIYTFNKSLSRSLPATSMTALSLLKAYLNAVPRGSEAVLGPLSSHRYIHRSRSSFRAFLSDNSRADKCIICPSLMGKISRGSRSSFKIQYRRLCDAGPNVIWKHWGAGRPDSYLEAISQMAATPADVQDSIVGGTEIDTPNL